MDSLFKFIFYLIIIVFWVINNTKKQNKLNKDLSTPPKRPYVPVKKPVPELASRQPSRESLFNEHTQSEMVPDVSMMTYEQLLEMRRKKAMARKNKQIKKEPALVVAAAPKAKKAEKKPEPAPVLKKMKKPSLGLKSSIKEGIMWSIILGPPRSRERLNWDGSPVQR